MPGISADTGGGEEMLHGIRQKAADDIDHDGNGNGNGDGDGDGDSKAKVIMWGYLPGASPQRTPLQVPTPVPALQEKWTAVCSGGCGFALAISETGKLITWGSTEDVGQSYITAGKHQEQPEPFPLPSDAQIVHAAAGWAHCAAVTGNGDVYTWGWQECVPCAKSSIEEAAAGASDQETHENIQENPESLPLVQPQFDQHFDNTEALPSPSSENTRNSLGTVYFRAKGQSPLDRPQQGGLASPTSKLVGAKSFPKVRSGGNIAGLDKLGDDGAKRRRLAANELVNSQESSSSNAGGDENAFALPCLVSLHPGVKICSAAAGGRHTLVLSDSGQVWGWGYGGEGQLGLGSRVRSVSSPHLVKCIESSSPFWRDNGSNNTGLRGSDSSLLKPPGTRVKAIACGGRHSAATTDAGALLTFGWGLYGQCGQGSTDDELSPCYVSSLGGLHIESVATGLWHTVCITREGDVYSFGGNQFGQLGTGGDQAEMFPHLIEAAVLEDEKAVSVSCGARHTAISTDTGKTFCWGWNKYGQLGLGDTVDRNTPTKVPLEDRAINVVCGWWHTLALAK